jgi:ubiquinone/menaquinone biosynthesis C-methylase UbiE
LDNNASEFLAEVGVKESQLVLDFGCGSGTYTIPAARLVGESGKVYALDISRRALERLKEKANREGLYNIVIHYSDGERGIRLGDGAVDHVLLVDVLQEIGDREALFEEVHRILKKDGRVSVYPMHMDHDEVVELASINAFNLIERLFDDRILVFGKIP